MLKDFIAPPSYKKAHLKNEAAGYDIVNEKEPWQVTELLEFTISRGVVHVVGDAQKLGKSASDVQ
jgi:hypothetical protein